MPSPNFTPEHLGRNTALLLAPQAVAWQLSFLLYGVYLWLLVQTVRGPLWTKFAVEVRIVQIIVLVLVTVYNILAFLDNIYWSITLKRSPDYIYIGWIVDWILPLVAALCGLVCQIFLAIRASVLITRPPFQKAFLGLICALSLCGFAGACLVVITAFLMSVGNIQGYAIGYNHSIAIWLCTSAIVDIMISISLYITLRQRSGIVREVDGLLQRLIFVALQTASYTAVPALVGAILSLVFPDDSVYSLVHFAFWMILPSCYGISLYTTISTRDMIDRYIAASNPFRFDPQQQQQQAQPPSASTYQYQFGHSFNNNNTNNDNLDSEGERRRRTTNSTTNGGGGGAGTVKRHPLAEIAPWAYNLHRRKSRSVAVPAGGGGGGAGIVSTNREDRGERAHPVDELVFESSPILLMNPFQSIGGREGGEGGLGGDELGRRTSSLEKGRDEEELARNPSTTTTKTKTRVEEKHMSLTTEQRRRVTEQLREREREREKELEEQQLREDNRRAIWW